MGAYHDNVTTRQNFVGAHVLVTIDLKFIDFKVISILQSENASVSIKALWYHKHLSISSIVVGYSSIWKSFDKIMKTRDVKVSTKGWRDRPQT